MNIDDLAKLMGKSREDVEDMLKSEEEISLNLSERSRTKAEKDPVVQVI